MDTLVAVLLALVLVGLYAVYRRVSHMEEVVQVVLRVSTGMCNAVHEMGERLDNTLAEVRRLVEEVRDTHTRAGVAVAGIEKNLERLRELKSRLESLSAQIDEQAEMLRRALGELSGIRRLEWLPGELRAVLEETLSKKLGEVKRAINALAKRIEALIS